MQRAPDILCIGSVLWDTIGRAPVHMQHGAELYVNLEEAGILCQRAFDDAPQAAAGLIARGASRVLVTDGPRPAADAIGASVISQSPPAVLATRVTGAGDTFMAAHWVAERRRAPRAAALAAALEAAARHVSGDSP
jgi:sugar/nucleoside kinase (ribokinase family)